LFALFFFVYVCIFPSFSLSNWLWLEALYKSGRRLHPPTTMYRTDERERHKGRKWGRTGGHGALQERGDRDAIGLAAASGATKRPRCIVGYSVTGISNARYSASAILFFSLFLSPLDLSLAFFSVSPDIVYI